MGKMLAKTLKELAKEKRMVKGARHVLSSLADSKLVILSDYGSPEIVKASQEAGTPVLRFDGTSVALGKMCGLQFRVSALALTEVDDSVVQSIIKENE